jgi:cryptochrome
MGCVEVKGGFKVYPKPMFDFNERRQVCIDKVKKASDVGM